MPCFVSKAGPHRDLHSFPTRRSSDLRRLRAAPARRPGPAPRQRSQAAPAMVHRAATAGPRSGRSEEHTSELQSRQYLVCRLLLEKKKKNKIAKKIEDVMYTERTR